MSHSDTDWKLHKTNRENQETLGPLSSSSIAHGPLLAPPLITTRTESSKQSKNMIVEPQSQYHKVG